MQIQEEGCNKRGIIFRFAELISVLDMGRISEHDQFPFQFPQFSDTHNERKWSFAILSEAHCSEVRPMSPMKHP